MKIKIGDLSCKMYYIALSIIIIANILFVESTIKNLFLIDRSVWLNYCENICWILLICRSVFLEKYNRKEITKVLCLFGLAMISMFLSGGSHLLLNSVLFIISSKNVDFKKIAKVVLVSNVIGVAITVFLAITGQIEANTMSRVYDGTRVVTRFSLGFSQPNYLGSHLFIICLCLSFLMFKRMSWKIVTLLLLVDIFIYLSCYSRTNCLLVIAILLVSLLTSKINIIRLNGHRVLEKFLKLLPILLFSIMILCTVFYSDRFLGTLNEIMSNRLLYAHEYYTNFGFSLLGQPVDFSEIVTRAYTIDCAYIYLAIRFGIIWALLFPFAFTKVCKRAIEMNRLDIVVLIATIALWGISETYYFRVQYNFVLILLGALLFSNVNRYFEGADNYSNEIIV